LLEKDQSQIHYSGMINFAHMLNQHKNSIAIAPFIMNYLPIIIGIDNPIAEPLSNVLIYPLLNIFACFINIVIAIER